LDVGNTTLSKNKDDTQSLKQIMPQARVLI